MTESVPGPVEYMGTVPRSLAVYWRQRKPREKWLLVGRATNWNLTWMIGQLLAQAYPEMEVAVTTEEGRLQEVHGTAIPQTTDRPGEEGPNDPTLPENQIRLPL